MEITVTNELDLLSLVHNTSRFRQTNCQIRQYHPGVHPEKSRLKRDNFFKIIVRILNYSYLKFLLATCELYSCSWRVYSRKSPEFFLWNKEIKSKTGHAQLSIFTMFIKYFHRNVLHLNISRVHFIRFYSN